MAKIITDRFNQQTLLKQLSRGVSTVNDAVSLKISEVRVVSEPGARAFEQEVNRLLQEGWVIIDAKVVSQSMHDPDSSKVCHSSRLRAILGKPSIQE